MIKTNSKKRTPRKRYTKLREAIYLTAIIGILMTAKWVSLKEDKTPPAEKPIPAPIDLTTALPKTQSPLDPAPAPDQTISKAQRFPNNVKKLAENVSYHCEETTRTTPFTKQCISSEPNTPLFTLSQQGTYASGGAFNHHFNNLLLAPYLNIPKSELVEYDQQIWYKTLPLPEGTVSLLTHISQLLTKKLNVPADKITDLISFLLNHRDPAFLELITPEHLITLKDYIQQYQLALNEDDISILIRLYPAWLELRRHDATYQSLRNHYLILRLFDMGKMLEWPEFEIMVQPDGNLFYPNLSSTQITSTPAGLPKISVLLFDFRELKTGPDLISPILAPKSFHPLTVFTSLTETALAEQLTLLKSNFEAGGLVPFNTKMYPTPLMIGKDFINIYKQHYPDPSVADDRAYEKAQDILLLLNHFAKTPPDPAKTTLWSEGTSDLFKALSGSILQELQPAPDRHMFNPISGIYQPPLADIEKRQRELEDILKGFQEAR